MNKISHNILDPESGCQRCKTIISFFGCPHCGNTFVSRDILRQTS